MFNTWEALLLLIFILLILLLFWIFILILFVDKLTSLSLMLLFDLLKDKLLFESLSFSLKLIKVVLVKCFWIFGNFDTVVAVDESSSLVLISWMFE